MANEKWIEKKNINTQFAWKTVHFVLFYSLQSNAIHARVLCFLPLFASLSAEFHINSIFTIRFSSFKFLILCVCFRDIFFFLLFFIYTFTTLWLFCKSYVNEFSARGLRIWFEWQTAIER